MAAPAATQPAAAAAAPLPFLGDDIFVLIAAELGARMLTLSLLPFCSCWRLPARPGRRSTNSRG